MLGGLAHGLFWSVVGAYAAHLVPKEQIGRAVSITVAGGTLAFVFGVPLATAAGHLIGWRMSFVALAVLMLIGAVLVWRFLPKVTHHAIRNTDTNVTRDRGTGRDEAQEEKDPTVAAVVLICCITALIMVGHYTFYTYIAPYLIDVLGVGTDGLAPLLFVFGIAGAVGLLLSGTVFGPAPAARHHAGRDRVGAQRERARPVRQQPARRDRRVRALGHRIRHLPAAAADPDAAHRVGAHSGTPRAPSTRRRSTPESVVARFSAPSC